MKSPINSISATEDTKVAVEHVDDLEKSVHRGPLDKFGSAAKVDPREVKLVKKLDLYIMVHVTHPTLTARYWLTRCLSQPYG